MPIRSRRATLHSLAEPAKMARDRVLKRLELHKGWDRNTSERGHGASEFLAGPGPAGVRSLVRDQ